MESLPEFLLYAASVAVIVIALAIVIAAYALYQLIQRVEKLVRSVRSEVEVLKVKRQKIEINGRTVFKLAKMAALLMLRRRIF